MEVNHGMHDSHGAPGQRRGYSGRMRWALIGSLAIAAFFLFTEHRAHVVSFLPFLLLAACPLMHLFHGRGGHCGRRDSGKHVPDRGEWRGSARAGQDRRAGPAG